MSGVINAKIRFLFIHFMNYIYKHIIEPNHLTIQASSSIYLSALIKIQLKSINLKNKNHMYIGQLVHSQVISVLFCTLENGLVVRIEFILNCIFDTRLPHT